MRNVFMGMKNSGGMASRLNSSIANVHSEIVRYGIDASSRYRQEKIRRKTESKRNFHK